MHKHILPLLYVYYNKSNCSDKILPNKKTCTMNSTSDTILISHVVILFLILTIIFTL